MMVLNSLSKQYSCRMETDNTMNQGRIVPLNIDHLDRYAEIYAAAFAGEPWNDPWKVPDARIHVKELMESNQAYGLEYEMDGRVAGFILGTSMLFHYGRTFEINDLAVDPAFQKAGIGSQLLEQCIDDVRKQGIVGIQLITAGEGILPEFYEKYGFQKEHKVILMSKDL